ERTVAVIADGITPTAKMVTEVEAPRPDVALARAAIDGVTRSDENVYLDARALANELFEDPTSSNVILLGAAWQKGLLPVTLASLEQAFRLNGAAVDRNLAALAWGRAWIAAPETVRSATAGLASTPLLSPAARQLIDRVAPESGSELR